MRTEIKLLIAALLSLSIGILSASPLLFSELNIVPFPHIPEGPKAQFIVDTIYANFSVNEHASNITSGGIPLNIVNYQLVLNVTNLSDLSAKIARLEVAAAQNITVEMGALGGFQANAGGGLSGGGGGGEIEGIWLDNKWVNVTWIPGTYPSGLSKVFTSSTTGLMLGPNRTWSVPTAIPSLPPNASETGYWMAGVPIREYRFVNARNNTITTYETIYINGAWVDVTGRVRIEHPQPDVIAMDTLLNNMVNFDTANNGIYKNATAFVQAMANRTATPSGMNRPVSDIWAGEGGFNDTWAPHESRLIMVNGTVQVGVNAGLESLAAGNINLYAGVFNYVNDMPVNGTYFNTFSSTTSLKQVPVEKTANGYLYNIALSGNEVFQLDQFGVEVSIKTGG